MNLLRFATVTDERLQIFPNWLKRIVRGSSKSEFAIAGAKH